MFKIKDKDYLNDILDNIIEQCIAEKNIDCIVKICKSNTQLYKNMLKKLYKLSSPLEEVRITPVNTFVCLGKCHICKNTINDETRKQFLVYWSPYPQGLICTCESNYCKLVASYSVMNTVKYCDDSIYIIPYCWLKDNYYSDVGKINIKRTNGDIVKGTLDLFNYAYFFIRNDVPHIHVLWSDSDNSLEYYHKWLDINLFIEHNDNEAKDLIINMVKRVESCDFENSVYFEDKVLDNISKIFTINT